MAYSERELIARMIQCEAGGEGDNGMKAVASVIMNRGFSEVYQVEALDTVFLPFQESADLRQQGSFRIGADIGRMGLQQRRLTEEPRLAAARTADHQNVFISGILRLLWTARHCDSLRLRHGDVLEKVLVHVGSDICRRTP